jgi:hypothetical protein
MSKEKSVRQLRGYSFLSQFAALLVFIIGAVNIILFIQPSLLGIVSDSRSAYQGQWLLFVFGWVFIILGIFFNIFVYRWPRSLLRILRTQPYTSMRFQLKVKEEGDRTQYYAYLVEPSSANDSVTWKIRLWATSNEVENWLGRICSAKVYRDPKTGFPAVIELENIYLWAMKGEAKQI